MYKRFDPITGKCDEIVKEIMQSPEVSPLNGTTRFKIRLCAEEAIENIISYAYGRNSGFIEVNSCISDNNFVLSLKDGGVPFNPLDRKDPDINKPLEEREVGGLGIFICKRMMDDVRYTYKDGCNILTMSIRN